VRSFFEDRSSETYRVGMVVGLAGGNTIASKLGK
jgi:hypothetical protein